MDDNYWHSVIEPEELQDLPFDEKRFQENQRRLLMTTTDEYKQAEEKRIENAKPKEHINRGFNLVWCPIEGRMQPEWLCALHHGDRDPSFDVDQEDWEYEED